MAGWQIGLLLVATGIGIWAIGAAVGPDPLSTKDSRARGIAREVISWVSMLPLMIGAALATWPIALMVGEHLAESIT